MDLTDYFLAIVILKCFPDRRDEVRLPYPLLSNHFNYLKVLNYSYFTKNPRLCILLIKRPYCF